MPERFSLPLRTDVNVSARFKLITMMPFLVQICYFFFFFFGRCRVGFKQRNKIQEKRTDSKSKFNLRTLITRPKPDNHRQCNRNSRAAEDAEKRTQPARDTKRREDDPPSAQPQQPKEKSQKPRQMMSIVAGTGQLHSQLNARCIFDFSYSGCSAISHSRAISPSIERNGRARATAYPLLRNLVTFPLHNHHDFFSPLCTRCAQSVPSFPVLSSASFLSLIGSRNASRVRDGCFLPRAFIETKTHLDPTRSLPV